MGEKCDSLFTLRFMGEDGEWHDLFNFNDAKIETEDLSHKIEKVIFNPPATIIYFGDGTKTVVKCGQHDEFNPDAGLALCLLKHSCENMDINFHSVLRAYTSSFYEMEERKKLKAEKKAKKLAKKKAEKANEH